MGKKNKKSRRYDDDDLLGGPLIIEAPPESNDDKTAQDVVDEGGDAPDIVGGDDAPIEEAESISEANDEPPPQPDKKQKGKQVNIDLTKLEETMYNILQKYKNNYQSEDWLYRTIEKNMQLPKNSLKSSVEMEILWDMLESVTSDVQESLDQQYDEEVKNKAKWDALVAEVCAKSELSDLDEAKLRDQASLVGLDPDESVATVREAIRDAAKNDVDQKDETEGQEKQLDNNANNASMSVSILLFLQLYIHQSSSTTQQSSSVVKIIFTLCQYMCLFMFKVLSLLLGKGTSIKADQLWETKCLPAIKAEQLAQEKVHDIQMLQKNTHLWSKEQKCWIEKDNVYPPLIEVENEFVSIKSNNPPTIRYNGKRNQWERWAKNLTTRTKAMKQGKITFMCRGTFVPVRVGEGWASAPDQPEVENEQIISAGIRFFVCLPMQQEGVKEGMLEVAEVSSWASNTIMPKEAARALGAVDSGKELFSLDVSSLLMNNKKKSGKKGDKNSKKNSKSKQDERNDDDEEEISVARKGIGCTAQVGAKYLNRMKTEE